MQTKPSRPAWFWPVAFFVGFAALLLFSNRESKTPEGDSVVHDLGSYNTMLKDAEALSKDRLAAHDQGKALSDDDVAKLRQAKTMFQQLNRYQPTNVGPFMGLAKIDQILGDEDGALQNYRQVIFNAPLEKRADQQMAVKLTAAEAQYQCSEILLRQNQPQQAFDMAVLAVNNVPQSSLYRTSCAAALIELKKYDQASEQLKQAVQLDPSNARAAGLLKFLSSGLKGGTKTQSH